LQSLLASGGMDGASLQDLPAPVTVRFVVPEFVSTTGQQLVLVGSVPQLGSWDAQQGARMTWSPGHRWVADVQLTPGWHGALEFKVRALMPERKRAFVRLHAAYSPTARACLHVDRLRWRSAARLAGSRATTVCLWCAGAAHVTCRCSRCCDKGLPACTSTWLDQCHVSESNT
jgi:hypothetical protein